jgi:hypothetical protein
MVVDIVDKKELIFSRNIFKKKLEKKNQKKEKI